jgi:hypothetical protein
MLLDPYPHLFEEEETYEPPQDPDSGKRILWLGVSLVEQIVG